MAKRFTGRSLFFFGIWILVMYGYLVSLIPQNPDIGTVLLLLFYINFPIALYAILLGLGQLGEKTDEVRELFAIDAPSAGLAILVGAMATFGVLLFTVGLQFELNPVPLGLVVLQALIIVPSEEFSFRFLLPHIMPGRFIGVPGWILAQGSFAAFHLPAISQVDILTLVFTLAFIFVFGLFLYLVTDAGKKYRVLGLGFAIGVHFIWNLFSFSAAGTASVAAFLGL